MSPAVWKCNVTHLTGCRCASGWTGGYLLLCTVDKLVLVGSLVARSDPFILPQRLYVFVKLLRRNARIGEWQVEDNLQKQLTDTNWSSYIKIHDASVGALTDMTCDCAGRKTYWRSNYNGQQHVTPHCATFRGGPQFEEWQCSDTQGTLCIFHCASHIKRELWQREQKKQQSGVSEATVSSASLLTPNAVRVVPGQCPYTCLWR